MAEGVDVAKRQAAVGDRTEITKDGPAAAVVDETAESAPAGAVAKDAKLLGEGGNAVADAESANPEIRQVSVNIVLPNGEKFEVLTSTLETYNDLRQAAMESPLASNYSCFHLKLDGRRVNYANTVAENLSDGTCFYLEEGKYNETEVRIQLNRLRDMLGGPLKYSPTSFGLDEGISAFSVLGVGSDVELKTGKDGDVEFNPELGRQHVFSDNDNFAVPKLSTYLPQMDRIPVQCLRNLSMSPWHPPPQHRRISGDIAYISVTTLEGEPVQVTAHVDGFFVNKSNAQSFDPSPRTPAKRACMSHTIVDLLTKISPRFGTQYKLLQETYSKHTISEIYPLPSAMLAAPWLARVPKHTPEPLRGADTYLKFGPEGFEALRDWNDEIQAHWELPRASVQDRLFRDRGLVRIYADFGEAAARGAQMIVLGGVQPINPLDCNDCHMYIHGGIFFSRGFDGREAFQKIGGDAAAHVATGKDLEGVKIFNSLDIEGLYTLGSTVVDYKGERIVAQTIVPGILRGANAKEKVVYGSFDEETKLRADPTFHELFGRAAEQLHLAEHEVDSGNGSRLTIYSSKEAKGLLGDDGRRYALDLYRTCPVDVEWLENECLETEPGESLVDDEKKLPLYPHQLVLLRPELVEAFWEYRLRSWAGEHAAAIAEKRQKAAGMSKGHAEAVTAEEPAAANNAEVGNCTNGETHCDVEPIFRKDGLKSALKEGKKSAGVSGDSPGLENQAKVEEVEAIDVSQFKLALNPDVFTDAYPNDYEKDETIKKQEEEVRACSKFLHDVIIPAFVHEATSEANVHFDSRGLSEQMRKFGINMRYLGRIALLLGKGADRKSALLKNVVVHEMVVRAGKHQLRSLLRGLSFVHVGDCVAHFLNCLLGDKFNADPRPALGPDEELVGNWEEDDLHQQTAKRDYRLLTPAGVRRAIQQDIAERYRYWVPDAFFEGEGGVAGFNRVSVLRGICLRVGVQMRCRDYLFTPKRADDNVPELVKAQEENGQKQGKRRKRSQSSDNEAPMVHSLTFLPEDVLNLFPIIKQAAPSSSLATETFEAGNRAIAQGQNELGWELLSESIAVHEQVYGLVHPEVAQCYASVAMIHYQKDLVESAADLQKRAVVAFERTVGFDGHEALHGYTNLGLYEYACGRHKAALRYLWHARKLAAVISGSVHPDNAIADGNVGMILQTIHDFERSLPFFESSRDIYTKLYGPDHADAANGCHHVARAKFYLQDYKGALENERTAFKVFKSLYGEDDARTKESGRWLQEFTKNAVATAKSLKHFGNRRSFAPPFAPAHLACSTVNHGPVAYAKSMAGPPAAADSGVGSMGHLPIDELLSYINRPGADKKRTRKAAKPQRKRIESQ